MIPESVLKNRKSIRKLCVFQLAHESYFQHLCFYSLKPSCNKKNQKPQYEPLAPRSREFQVLGRFVHQYDDYQHLAVDGSFITSFSLCFHIHESESAVFLAELLCFCTSQQLTSLTLYFKIRCSSHKTGRK